MRPHLGQCCFADLICRPHVLACVGVMSVIFLCLSCSNNASEPQAQQQRQETAQQLRQLAQDLAKMPQGGEDAKRDCHAIATATTMLFASLITITAARPR